MLVLTLFVGFLIGVLTVIAVEAVGVVFVIGRLNRRVKQEQEKADSQSSSSLDPSSHVKKQGVLWILNPEKLPKSKSVEKVPRETKRKKDFLEVSPVQIFAKIKDKSLILAHSDGARREIQLTGCTVVAVSATTLSSRKWAKRYPIKVENERSTIYEGSKSICIYLETSWEKESWCKALRIASCTDNEKLKWFSQLNLEFQSYLATLNVGYPLFMKPSVDLGNEHMGKSVKPDNSSKVRLYFKKLSKKMAKGDNKASGALTSGREERKVGEKWHPSQDSVMGSAVAKTSAIGKAPNSWAERKVGPPSSTSSNSGSLHHNTLLCDADCDDNFSGDEGTLCWNLLISRLFFDARRNTAITSAIQSRIQRTLSSMRIPSFMSEIACTGIDLGILPPYLSGMRILPSDMKEVWAMEIDIQYSGGVVLDVETRLEVCESDLKEGEVDISHTESSSVEEVPPDILEGFQYLDKQLELSEGPGDATKQKDETNSEPDGMRTAESNRKALPASKWKSVINSVAKQVSQVPLSLAIKVVSLKGTLRLHVKPPPSDQLWFGFSSMPDIDFELESHVGERKINSGGVALFLISRFKTAIRETLVLPNCENVCIPWMLAEKDDWVPCNVAPFMWRANNPEVAEASVPSTSTAANTIAATSDGDMVPQSIKQDKEMKVEELKVPLLTSSNNEGESSTRDDTEKGKEKERALEFRSSPSQSSSLVPEGDDDGPSKRMGTRARMRGLGKKMGEKFEEKRRAIEERGRHMVERMKGPQ